MSDPTRSNDHFATLDHRRSVRLGMPEAVFCSGKTPQQCLAIVEEFLATGRDAVIATRTDEAQRALLTDLAPTQVGQSLLTWNHRPSTGRRIAVVTAGTSDIPVADEAAGVLMAMGHHVDRITDVGVAGLHRLLDTLPRIEEAEVVLAVAGMEGSLPTVLAGLIPQPIIAIPTSVGYGSSLDGVTALLSMMASCAPGLSVVGIDNGYGAACAAHRILGMPDQ
ncbi:MAG: nickel pincer cofactor biosynthesis protein LarB [Acidimicrobiales bacterium]